MTQQIKLCTKCRTSKPLTDFYTLKNGKQSWWCKNCSRDQANSRSLEYYRKNPYRKYGKTKQDFDEMAKAQDYKCALCRREKKLVMDHSHSSGKVRGLLCDGCNVALGMFLDDPELLRRAASYVEGGINA